MYRKGRSALARRAVIALVAAAVAVAYMFTPVPARALDQVSISVDTSPVVGNFYTTDFKYSNNTMYYKAVKDVNVQWHNTESLATGETVRIELQRLDNGEWFVIDHGQQYVYRNSYTYHKKFEIQQDTPKVTSYRIHVSGNTGINTEDTYSPVFTIEGKKQSVGAVVKYSKSSQKFKKTPVKVTVSTTRAYAASAAIYDGKKKLKTFRISHGSAVSWNLPKKLKVGTHNITVKVTPRNEFAPFYGVYTSNIKKIKVKK
jgi:hypothetical protein